MLSRLIWEADDILHFWASRLGILLDFFELFLALFTINLGQLVRFEISDRYHISFILFNSRRVAVLSRRFNFSDTARILSVSLESIFRSHCIYSQL